VIIDLHTHTLPWSDDSQLYPVDLINHAKQAGLDGICFTEHDWFWETSRVAELSQEHDFLILPGVETNTEEGHLLVFGLEKYVFGMHHAGVVRQLVDEVGGAIILAHPHRRQFPTYGSDESDYYPALERACNNPVFELVDGVEVLNGRASPKENAFSLELSRKSNSTGCGGSDAHCASDVGSAATLFQRQISCLEDLITELKAGRFTAASLRQGL
jgi:hypothetical protein